MILKVQKPIFPAPQTGDWLFYNQDRSIFLRQQPVRSIIEMMGSDTKMYIFARLTEGSNPKVRATRRVRTRPW